MKNFVRLMVILVMSIMLTACGSDIDDVRSGKMNFNTNMEIGDALDSWDDCSSSKWSSFESKNGKEVVEFKCVKANTKDFFKNGVEILIIGESSDSTAESNANLKKIWDIKDVTQIFQFTVTPKGVIRLGNVSNVYTWKDGFKKTNSVKSVRELKKAYNNIITYNPGDIHKNISPANYQNILSINYMLYLFRIKEAKILKTEAEIAWEKLTSAEKDKEMIDSMNKTDRLEREKRSKTMITETLITEREDNSKPVKPVKQ